MPKAYWINTFRSVSDPDRLAAYESPAYQAALSVLGNAAERDLRIIEAVS
jgi:uncharacterized protein (DUF1330 family)